MRILLAFFMILIMIVAAIGFGWLLARNPPHDPADGLPDGDEPFLSAQTRRAIHSEAYPEEWR